MIELAAGELLTGDDRHNIHVTPLYKSLSPVRRHTQQHAEMSYIWRRPVVSFVRKKSSPYSITERRVPERIPVLGSQCQSAGDVSHKPGGRLPLLTTRPTVTLPNA